MKSFKYDYNHIPFGRSFTAYEHLLMLRIDKELNKIKNCRSYFEYVKQQLRHKIGYGSVSFGIIVNEMFNECCFTNTGFIIPDKIIPFLLSGQL